MTQYFESSIEDVLLILNYECKRTNFNDEEDCQKISNTFMIILDAMYDDFKDADEVMFNKWVAENALNVTSLTIEDFIIKVQETYQVTLEDLLRVYKGIYHLTEFYQIPVKTTYLLNEYKAHEEAYRGKPIDSILGNSDLYNHIVSFITCVRY